MGVNDPEFRDTENCRYFPAGDSVRRKSPKRVGAGFLSLLQGGSCKGTGRRFSPFLRQLRIQNNKCEPEAETGTYL
jgi:hypothetical protein